VSGAAILLLVGLASYFLRTLDRYLELRAREASQRQLAQLGQMAATLAHEIRNPLGAMKGLTQLVQEGLDDQDQNRELTRTVVSEAERLENLVADLLTYARPRPLESTTLDLDALVADVCRFLSARALEASVTLSQDNRGSRFEVAADSDGVRQVLLNVIVNAIDAAPAGTTVDVILSEHRSMIHLEVLDRGAGIGSIDPEELFQPFKTTKTKGSGLGLAISRQIVEALGGTIGLENRSGGGAVCRVSLPRG
jgi:two-component system sensor histidine kinase HydH